MKVLLVSNFFYPRGGDCTYLRSVQSMLERDGHEIAIFSTQHEGNWPLPAAGGILIPAIDYAAASVADIYCWAMGNLGASLSDTGNVYVLSAAARTGLSLPLRLLIRGRWQ